MSRSFAPIAAFRSHLWKSFSLGLLISFSACNPIALLIQPSSTATGTPAPSSTPTSTSTLTPTSTVRPTSTPRPPTDTPTVNPTATERAKLRRTLEAALAKIEPEMDKVGLVATDGHIEWIDPDPYTLKVGSYGENQVSRLGVPSQKDFVLHTEITWNSSSGLAGCGIIFRADEDIQKGGQYAFVLMRLEFEPLWGIEYYKMGRFERSLTGQLLSSSAIKDEALSTNKITLVAQGNEFTPYINGNKLQTVTNDAQPEGILAFHAWQESGDTTCKFSNSWLWAPGPGEYSEPSVES